VEFHGREESVRAELERRALEAAADLRLLEPARVPHDPEGQAPRARRAGRAGCRQSTPVGEQSACGECDQRGLILFDIRRVVEARQDPHLKRRSGGKSGERNKVVVFTNQADFLLGLLADDIAKNAPVFVLKI